MSPRIHAKEYISVLLSTVWVYSFNVHINNWVFIIIDYRIGRWHNPIIQVEKYDYSNQPELNYSLTC